MKTLREAIKEAEQAHIAIGHFNFCNIETFWAVVKVARHMELPIILGVTEAERNFIGIRQAIALVQSTREQLNHPIFISADQISTLSGVREAVEAGYDIVSYDATKKLLKQNIEETKAVVHFAKSRNPDILVEGGMEYIGFSSKLYEYLPDDIRITPEHMTDPKNAEKFVRETGVDLFAPAVGNVHGKLKHESVILDIDRIKQIKEVVPIPLVLHGASSVRDIDFHRAIPAGISIVQISTELSLAYRDALKDTLIKLPGEIAPYKLMENVIYEMEKIVEIKLQTFIRGI